MGLVSTSLSVSTYLISLDSISFTLKTRDSKTVNMGIAVASIINGLCWGLYALLTKDIYVLVPNVTALMSASIQLKLYQWTVGSIDNTHPFIRLLQSKFNMRGNKALKVIQEDKQPSHSKSDLKDEEEGQSPDH